MSEINITLEGGTSKRLLTAGKYCDRDIVVNVAATGTSADALVDRTFSGEYKSETVKSVGYGCFYGCAGLTYASFPNATSVGGYAFYSCSNVEKIDVPKMTGTIGLYTFAYCSKLKELRLPLTTGSVGQYAFNSSKALELVELGNVSSLGTNCFANCTNLTALIIRRVGTSITSIPNANALANTAIAKGTGYVYFPRDLVDAQKSATGWSSIASQIRALEDYTVDGTTTGALDESKI